MISPELYLKCLFFGKPLDKIDDRCYKIEQVGFEVIFDADIYNKEELYLSKNLIESTNADVWCVTVGICPLLIRVTDLKDIIIDTDKENDDFYIIKRDAFKSKAIEVNNFKCEDFI
jgi:hypothetical protein